METDNIDIKPYTEIYREQMLTIWEKSVFANHDFFDFNLF